MHPYWIRIKKLLEDGRVKQGIKLSAKNIGINAAVEQFPLYMAMFL